MKSNGDMCHFMIFGNILCCSTFIVEKVYRDDYKIIKMNYFDQER